jgi:nucleoside-diphosphate-sugar epimerase
MQRGSVVFTTEQIDMAIKKVIVAGVGGTLGPPVIKQLLAKGFEVTALTGKPEQVEKAYKDQVPARQANYSSVETLAASLQDCDALVILLNRNAFDAQILLIDAAVAAGVPHIVPSCFGQDSTFEEWRKNPAAEEKIRMEDYVVKLAEEGKITFTGIQTGLFLDWAVRANFLLNCKSDGPSMLFDGGDTSFSTTSLDDIGTAVANSLAALEKTKNNFVKVQSAAVSQNQLLKYGRMARPQWQWQTVAVDTEALYKRSQAALDGGDRSPEVMRGFLAWPSFGQGRGLFRSNDNELLGIVEWSEERLAKLVSDVIEENAGA